MRKLCLSTKFPHQEIRRNYGILRSAFSLATNKSLEKQLEAFDKSMRSAPKTCYNQQLVVIFQVIKGDNIGY